MRSSTPKFWFVGIVSFVILVFLVYGLQGKTRELTPSVVPLPEPEVPIQEPAPQETETAATENEEPAVTEPIFFIAVSTSKPSYKTDENIKILGSTLPEASVTLQVINQYGSMQRTRLLVADANGNYEDNFKFGNTIAKGTYTVNVTASKTGHTTISNFTTFELTR